MTTLASARVGAQCEPHDGGTRRMPRVRSVSTCNFRYRLPQAQWRPRKFVRPYNRL